MNELKQGDYVYLAGRDTEDNREVAKQVMARNGCKSFRFEKQELPDESIVIRCHGYLANIDCSDFDE